MQHQTIHLNGTSKERLLEQWSNAYDALRVALEKLAEAGPNGRDYYPQGLEALYKAQDEHHNRMQKVLDVMKDLQTLCEEAS